MFEFDSDSSSTDVGVVRRYPQTPLLDDIVLLWLLFWMVKRS